MHFLWPLGSFSFLQQGLQAFQYGSSRSPPNYFSRTFGSSEQLPRNIVTNVACSVTWAP